MTRSIKSIAVLTSLIVTTFSVSAKETATLNANDWNSIAEQAEMASILEIESIPAIQIILTEEDWNRIAEEAMLEEMLTLEAEIAAPVKQAALNLELKSGKKTNVALDAPFNPNEHVGVVVVDQEGNLIHSASGTFLELKQLKFEAAFVKSANYIIRVYSAEEVYETTLQVLNL